MAWFRVAAHLHVPVAELAARITYSEFLDWVAFLALEDERHTKQDHYLAQIAAEIHRGQVKHPRKVKLSQFLLRFTRGEKSETTSAPNRAGSKAIWAAALGVKIK